MDIELVRTFLEVNRLRHFGRAAERLYVTPAAVSARVRLLEEHLGTVLFNRARNNIGLTPAGQRFLPHAENMVRSWHRAVASVGGGGDLTGMVALGSLHSIWNVLLQHWLPTVYERESDVALQVELLPSQAVIARVREQSLDLALVYEPPQARDLRIEPVSRVSLGLFSDRPGLTTNEALTGYVHVDWGVQFAMALARAMPDLPDPVLRVDTPEIAQEFLGRRGGAAYLPRKALGDDVSGGRLHPVSGAPRFDRTVYLVESAEAAESSIRDRVRLALVDWLESHDRADAEGVSRARPGPRQ
jgi:DNA-binding transcriptional LysR family regulator